MPTKKEIKIRKVLVENLLRLGDLIPTMDEGAVLNYLHTLEDSDLVEMADAIDLLINICNE